MNLPAKYIENSRMMAGEERPSCWEAVSASTRSEISRHGPADVVADPVVGVAGAIVAGGGLSSAS